MTTTAEYITNIRKFYDRADENTIREGRTWYPSMARIMREHATQSGLRATQCAAIYAAASINTPWARNLALAAQAINDYMQGRDALHNGGTLGMVVSKIRAIVAGADDNDLDGILTTDPNNYKIVNFRRNLVNDETAVTVDRWAYRVATNFEDCEFNGERPCTRNRAGKLTGNGHSCGKVPTGAQYQTIADAYRTVARECNERPHDLQAITWCVARGTGE